MNGAVVENALVEILHFPSAEHRHNSRQRCAVEIGWTFDHDSYKSGHVGALMAKPLHDFPSLRLLVSSAMVALTGNDDLMEERLNVSCLLYSAGHDIAMHCDRPYCYEKNVYGCVLLNSSDRSLEFHGLSSVQRFVLPERAGVCFE